MKRSSGTLGFRLLRSWNLRKLLFIAVLLPIVAGLGWWYFREESLPDYGPAFREYAYVTNGKSNTVSVIDLRTFALAKTLHVGSEPTGIAANSRKNEIYVVNSGSNNVNRKSTRLNSSHPSISYAVFCLK